VLPQAAFTQVVWQAPGILDNHTGLLQIAITDKHFTIFHNSSKKKNKIWRKFISASIAQTQLERGLLLTMAF
jgi:hypothetical protein